MLRYLAFISTVIVATTPAIAAGTKIDTSMLDGGSVHVFFHDDGCVEAMKAEMPPSAYAKAAHLGDDAGAQSDVKHLGKLYVGSAVLDDQSGHQMLDVATDGKKVWTRLMTGQKATFYGSPPSSVKKLLTVKY